jgi:hypothetical protein
MTGNQGAESSNEGADLDVDRLREMTAQMIEALTAPAYVEAVRAVKETPVEQRLVEASRRLSPDGLRELGVPIPPGMRISSRYFERDFPSTVELGDPPSGGVNKVNALNEIEPGLLDRLRRDQFEFYRKLADEEGVQDLGTEIPETLAFGGCTCGGRPVPPFGTTVCGGAGVYL